MLGSLNDAQSPSDTAETFFQQEIQGLKVSLKSAICSVRLGKLMTFGIWYLQISKCP